MPPIIKAIICQRLVILNRLEKREQTQIEARGLTSLEEDSSSSVDEDALLHGETLCVVATVDSENVALIVISQNLTIDFLTHSSVEEGTTVQNRCVS